MNLTRVDGIPGKNVKHPESPSVHFRRMDRREWWLWSAAVAVTLLLTVGLALFLLPGLNLLPSSEDGGGEIRTSERLQ